MLNLDRITFDPQIMAGQACIRDIRVPVSLILNLVANGQSIPAIIEDYPYLEVEDIQQALRYAAWLSTEQVYLTTEVLLQCSADLQAGAIVSVNEQTFRVRKLPL
jgi:uncharacterized protein (DUF433 family)